MSVKSVKVSISNEKIEDPGTTKAKKNMDTVRWELEGDGDLKISFKDSPFGPPPGAQPDCGGGVCEVFQAPREGSEGKFYKYTIEVTRGEKKYPPLDPNVEVIP